EGIIRLTDDRGHVHELHTQAALPGIYLYGGGYFGTQGKPLGDHHEGETYDVASDDTDLLATYLADIGADQPAVYTIEDTCTRGFGVLEINWGPHHKKYPANIR